MKLLCAATPGISTKAKADISRLFSYTGDSLNILDFLFPKRCLGCGRFGSYLCQSCRDLQKLHGGSICPVCERPAVDGRTHPICRTSLALDGATFIFAYQPPVSLLLKKLKYRFARELCQLIVSWTRGELRKMEFPHLKGRLTVIPVPLHQLRSNWRGFNQAEMLGGAIARELGWEFRNDVLVRSRWRRPQTEVKIAKKRASNVRGIFDVLPNAPACAGRPIAQCPNVLLFDDVWTTGATMKEAGRALKRAGFKSVWGLTIAR